MVQVYPGTVVVRLDAESITLDHATGSLRLEGKVRVTFRDGGELQAESMTLKTTSNGLQEFRGHEIRLIKTESH
jgi:hypothetical protein